MFHFNGSIPTLLADLFRYFFSSLRRPKATGARTSGRSFRMSIPVRTIAAGVIDGALGTATSLSGCSFVKLGVGQYLVVLSTPANPAEMTMDVTTLSIGGVPAAPGATVNIDHLDDRTKVFNFAGGGGLVAFLVYNGALDVSDFQTNILTVTRVSTGFYDVILSVPAPAFANSLPLASVLTTSPRIVTIDEFDVGPTRTYRLRTWTQADVVTAADSVIRLAVWDTLAAAGGAAADVQFQFTIGKLPPGP